MADDKTGGIAAMMRSMAPATLGGKPKGAKPMPEDDATQRPAPPGKKPGWPAKKSAC